MHWLDMTFNVEVLLKGKEEVVDRTVEFDGPAPSQWSDGDVEKILLITLTAFQDAQNPDNDERSPVSLRGFSWIVTPVEGGVAIAIEIGSGAVVSGPFKISEDELSAMIRRVLANHTHVDQVH